MTAQIQLQVNLIDDIAFGLYNITVEIEWVFKMNSIITLSVHGTEIIV